MNPIEVTIVTAVLQIIAPFIKKLVPDKLMPVVIILLTIVLDFITKAISGPLVGAGLFLLRRYKPRPRATPAPPQHRIDDLAQARALLGVASDADPAAIRAAHRRLIASVHPDKGGTEALAAQINAARDLLLADRQEG